MRKQKTLLLLCNLFCCILLPLSAQKPATNPVIYADAPDMSMLRVGDTYYMSSTTMHMSPGVPIMKSNDLVNWKLVNYAYDTLANIPTMNLDDGKKYLWAWVVGELSSLSRGSVLSLHFRSDYGQDIFLYH